MIDKIYSLNKTNLVVNIAQNVSDLSDATHQTEYQTSLTRTIIAFDQNTDKTNFLYNNQSNPSIEHKRIEILAIWIKTEKSKNKNRGKNKISFNAVQQQ